MDTQKIEAAVKMIIEAVGEDVNREGLQETPARVARMYQEIFSCLLYTSPSPRDYAASRMPSSA